MELNVDEEKIVNAPCPTNMYPKNYLKRYKQQKWTLKNFYANKFSKIHNYNLF